MRVDLTGRKAIVTASTSGIGLSIVKGLLNAGADVVLNGRRREVTDCLVIQLAEQFPDQTVQGVSADLARKEEIERFVKEIPDADILVNNLGIYDKVKFFDISDEEWLRYFETNVMSGVRLSRHYMPGMMERNWGRLLFITSESGVTTPADRMHYGTTKTAMLAVARGLAEVARNTGVTSNSIVVGITQTEPIVQMIEESARTQGISIAEVHQQIVNEHRPTQLLGRPATSEEVANMVVYAASPQASATTGAALRVEGGGITTIL
jgi:NAD(P)-dependent dehydrogenase (short-subunit alcohol dehydrogenase family)